MRFSAKSCHFGENRLVLSDWTLTVNQSAQFGRIWCLLTSYCLGIKPEIAGAQHQSHVPILGQSTGLHRWTLAFGQQFSQANFYLACCWGACGRFYRNFRPFQGVKERFWRFFPLRNSFELVGTQFDAMPMWGGTGQKFRPIEGIHRFGDCFSNLAFD